jgi:hypothetical protein
MKSSGTTTTIQVPRDLIDIVSDATDRCRNPNCVVFAEFWSRR